MTTVEEIRAKPSTFLTASDIGTLIGIRPDNIIWQARQDPSKLGFPVCVAANTVRIPKWAFLDWLLGSSNSRSA